MTYSAAAILALASQCAPTVAPATVLAIVQTESRGDPFALNVNGGRQPTRQSNTTVAAATAQRYIAAGYSVDLGLGQINSRNMRWLGLTWETVFDPCTNVAALGRVLTTNYNAAKARDASDPDVLVVAATCQPHIYKRRESDLLASLGHTQDGRKEQLALFPNDPFPTPKPESLIKRIVEIATLPGDLVLDCASGRNSRCSAIRAATSGRWSANLDSNDRIWTRRRP